MQPQPITMKYMALTFGGPSGAGPMTLPIITLFLTTYSPIDPPGKKQPYLIIPNYNHVKKKYAKHHLKAHIVCSLNISDPGGYSVQKRVLTVARLPRSCGYREQKLLKSRGCPVIMNVHRELSKLVCLYKDFTSNNKCMQSKLF